MITVYSYYVMDIVHRGHLLMMRNGKAMAGEDGKFIVGILTDEATMEKKPRPILPFDERIAIALAIEYVDIAVPQHTYSPLDNVRDIKPDILLESSSHTKEAIQEARDVVSEWGGRVIVFPYYPGISSTGIKQTIRGDEK